MIDTILKSYKAIGSGATTGINGISAIITATGRQSIAKMSKDSIFQFSTIVSSSIDTDELQTILKSTEQVYATMLVSALSLQGSIDRSKYKDTVEFLRKFHTNDLTSKTLESDGTTYNIEATIAEEGTFTKADVDALWENVLESQLDMSKLNDTYKPFNRTKWLIHNRLDTREVIKERMNALEADNPFPNNPNIRNLYKGFKNVGVKKDPFNTRSSYNNSDGYGAFASTIKTKETIKETDKNGKEIEKEVNIKPGDKFLDTRGKYEVVKTDKLASMEPTVINITLVNYNESAKWTQNVVLGVKTMARVVPSGAMIESMIGASKDRAIFKFIKWTKGEYKLSTLLADIFGITAAKEIAHGKNKWFAALSKRKAINNVTKLLNRRLLPNCTIIITEAECEEIKRLTGVDFKNPKNVRTLMNKYFLLGFGIYDTDGKMYDIMYDSDTDFASYPLRALIAQSKKEIVMANK